MTLCYLGLGSNQKCPERQIREAITALGNLPSTAVLKASSIYWTKAWGLTAQQDFCNAVVEITTRLAPELLLDFCQSIEKKHGRIRKKHWGPRTLDIDILLYGNRKIKSKRLSIPHPHLLFRHFVLAPLLEINPHILLTLPQ